jgi:hypothetical protein
MAYSPPNLPTTTAESRRLAISIGGFSLGMWCSPGMPVALDPEHQPFLLSSTSNDGCHFELDIAWTDSLELPHIIPSFSSGGLWSAFVSETGTKFYFSSVAVGPLPYKAAWFDPSFQRGHIVLNRSVFPQHAEVFPLEYPLDELAIMHRLALGEGVEVHALGLADMDGSGYLFLGHSGAGKSTTARLWMEQPGVTLLSDDRVILRQQNGKFWMYGTPWHGDAGVAAPACAPLDAVFLLEQALVNEVTPVASPKAAAELFARSFVPHYLQSGIQFTLDFLDQLTRSVSCSVLRFTPTPGAVEAVRYVRV